MRKKNIPKSSTDAGESNSENEMEESSEQSSESEEEIRVKRKRHIPAKKSSDEDYPEPYKSSFQFTNHRYSLDQHPIENMHHVEFVRNVEQQQQTCSPNTQHTPSTLASVVRCCSSDTFIRMLIQRNNNFCDVHETFHSLIAFMFLESSIQWWLEFCSPKIFLFCSLISGKNKLISYN